MMRGFYNLLEQPCSDLLAIARCSALSGGSRRHRRRGRWRHWRCDRFVREWIEASKN